MKGLPFLIGATSYLFPADILINVKKMAIFVDDIEILFFESEKYSNLPSKSVISELKKIKNDFNYTYTVHLPLDLKLGDSSSTVRQASIDQIKRIIDLTGPLTPFAYECHLNQPDKVKSTPKHSKAKAEWQKNCFNSLSCLFPFFSSPEIFCIENIESYCLEEIIPFVKEFPFSLCFDVGHVWQQKKDPVKIIQEYYLKIKVIHLYGINGRYHTSLECMRVEDVFSFLDELLKRRFSKILTIEVFKEEDFNSSLNLIKDWWHQKGVK